MRLTYELRRLVATLIFDLEDRYAREQGFRGTHPRPIGDTRFYVVGQRIGGVRQDLAQPQELVIQRNPSGYHLFFDEIRLPDGTTRQAALPKGEYVVRVEGQFYQWAERQDIKVPAPDSPYSFDLDPGYMYPFPDASPYRASPCPPVGAMPSGRGPTLLRGELHSADGQGIAHALVQVVGQPATYLTDETGNWVLVLPTTLPTGNVTVRFDLPDGTTEYATNVCVVQGRETRLAPTALRGWVHNAAGVGLAGATVRVPGYPGQTKTASDGSWFYYFGVNQLADTVSVTAILPDGRSQTLVNVKVQPRATVVVSTFRFL